MNKCTFNRLRKEYQADHGKDCFCCECVSAYRRDELQFLKEENERLRADVETLRKEFSCATCKFECKADGYDQEGYKICCEDWEEDNVQD